MPAFLVCPPGGREPGHHWGRTLPPAGEASLSLAGLLHAGGGAGVTMRGKGAEWTGLLPGKAPMEGGSPSGIKGSSIKDSPHSSFSKHRLKMCRGKVKLCGNFQSHPLKINSPFKGITHLTPS